MNEKICPLLGAGPVGINTNCKEDRCAWWNTDHCAVKDIATGSLYIGEAIECAVKEVKRV